MPKKKPFVEHQLRFFSAEEPWVQVQDSDRLQLEKYVEEVSDPQKWVWGSESVYRSMLQAVSDAKYLYNHSVRSYGELRDTLTQMDTLIKDLLPRLEKCYRNDLLTDHSMHHYGGPRSDVDQHLESSRVDVAQGIADGLAVFWPPMIEQFPVKSCLYSALVLQSILGRQLETIEQDFKNYEYARNPDSDAISHAVYELWWEYGRDNVKYPGSASGAPARLYRHLCKIADIPKRNEVAALRKFGKES